MTDTKRADQQQTPSDTALDQQDQAREEQDGGTHAPEAELIEPEEISPRERELEAQIEEMRERLLRALAETENLRRRSEREIDDTRKYAVSGFARQLLDVADNLNRALASIPPEAQGSELIRTLAEGVAMTERTLLGAFEKHQITKIEPLAGEKFDHNRHQAMLEIATDQQPPGSVAQVMAPGYMIADRLLRPAMVGVARAPAPERPAEEADEAPAGEDERVVEIRRGARANSDV